MVLFLVAQFLYPWRREVMWGIRNCVIAPFGIVTFYVSYIGDVFTSLAKVFTDIAYSACFFASGAQRSRRAIRPAHTNAHARLRRNVARWPTTVCVCVCWTRRLPGPLWVHDVPPVTLVRGGGQASALRTAPLVPHAPKLPPLPRHGEAISLPRQRIQGAPRSSETASVRDHPLPHTLCGCICVCVFGCAFCVSVPLRVSVPACLAQYAFAHSVVLFGVFHPTVKSTDHEVTPYQARCHSCTAAQIAAQCNVLLAMSISACRIRAPSRHPLSHASPARPQALWIASLALSTLYTYSWDVIMDWGLGRPQHSGLRERLMYRRVWVYYGAFPLFARLPVWCCARSQPLCP